MTIRDSVLQDIDDASFFLKELSSETDLKKVLKGLVRIVIHIRTVPHFRAGKTESIGQIEADLTDFLNRYSGKDFEQIYPVLRELIRHIPKFQIFGIDIAELRDIAHDFDAEFRYNDIFSSIASDIRKLTHQNLSKKVITKIEKFQDFLSSDKSSGIIDGSTVVGATEEDKEEILESGVFGELVRLKDKLKIAWAGSGDNREKVYSQKEFINVIRLILNDLSLEEIMTMPAYVQFLDIFVESLDRLRDFQLEEVQIGKIRYHLKKFIENVMKGKVPNKGGVLFRLMTIDALVEQIAFIHYSDIVNSDLLYINDENYPDALRVLFELALCSRAVGHGNKHLGRFAFLLENIRNQMKERPDRAAHFPTIIDAMNSELENNFFYLQELYSSNIDAPTAAEKFSTVNKILNNLIREKTTHLLANLINNVKTYHEEKEKERFVRVLNILEKKGKFCFRDYIFRFGTDIKREDNELECPEFMGGKGYSQVTNSRIILENDLAPLDVPMGTGFSTLAWYMIKNNRTLLHELKSELRNIVADLEKRTGKIFGSGTNPLYLMARSGAVISMPGVLDTISHIGINRKTALAWASVIEEPLRAYQAYMSFILSYAKSVLGIDTNDLIKDSCFENMNKFTEKNREQIETKIDQILKKINELSGEEKESIPEDPFEQLYNSVLAVFRSYENEIVQKQAMNYGIPEQFQTACLVQECLPVLTSKDCSGVLFTRHPGSGRMGQKYGEYIEYGDGYFGNVIADGTITPSTTQGFINRHRSHYEIFKKFKYFDEREQRYPTDIEFAIREDIAYIVQSRVLKQSPIGLIMNSFDFFREGIYSPFKLIKRTAFSINREVIESYLDRKKAQEAPVIAHGKPVNGGAVRGRIIKNHNNIGKFDDQLIFITESNVPPIVIMKEQKFSGYISKEGGITSHAALVAIGERKPCVTDVKWEHGKWPDDIIFGGTLLKEGDYITLDANTGNIYQEEILIIESCVIDKEFKNVQKHILGVIDDLVDSE